MKNQIPKKVHIVWLGGELSSDYRDLLEKNKTILKDYEFIIWNDDNVKELIKEHRIQKYIEESISMGKKKYAFAADAIKLIALEKFGGWALDADVEIFKTLDPFLNYNWVTSFERCCGADMPYLQAVTAVWGAIPEHMFTKQLIKIYEINSTEAMHSKPNSHWISDLLYSKGLKRINLKQRMEEYDLDIYPSEYFCVPFHEENTYAQHLFNGSWK